jgi:hypothetical protein
MEKTNIKITDLGEGHEELKTYESTAVDNSRSFQCRTSVRTLKEIEPGEECRFS